MERMERKKYVPHWLIRFDEGLQRNVMLILDRCNAIFRRLSNVNGESDEADLEAARIDLRDTLSEMEKEPLWAAVMAIRPQVINGRLPTSITEEIAQALRAEKNTDFGNLVNQLDKYQMSFFRAVISGGEFRGAHYFPGIPLSVRKEAEVRLTTHPDNLQMIVKAYCLMAEKTTGHARTALDAVIADIKELSQNI